MCDVIYVCMTIIAPLLTPYDKNSTHIGSYNSIYGNRCFHNVQWMQPGCNIEELRRLLVLIRLLDLQMSDGGLILIVQQPVMVSVIVITLNNNKIMVQDSGLNVDYQQYCFEFCFKFGPSLGFLLYCEYDLQNIHFFL